jgi:hypothetical protein
MNREEITRMAKEAGYLAWHIDPRAERFADLVAAAEREACAKRVEVFDKAFQTGGVIAHALRERGNK